MASDPTPPLHGAKRKLPPWIPAAVFALLSLLIYADVLFTGDQVPGSPRTDLQLQFLSWRQFGFNELLTGNLPLWNPHIFGGAPYMASFQSALFYPINWLHLILPLGLAISWYYAIHTFLMGLTTSLWARYRGAGLAGQTLAGVMMMFSGQFFLHGYAGHLPHLAVMVWVPLIFLATDALADGRKWTWALGGAAALAMEILAGHPQYVFYTGIVLGLYALCRLITSRHRLYMVGCLIAMGILGVGLSAIQLLPGIVAARENVRIGGLSYEMAAQFSAGPEQWMTLLAPYLFGHLHPFAGTSATTPRLYLGYGYLWELSFFVSITGLVLAGVGLAKTSRANRITCVLLLVIFCAISAGRYLPLHHLLYSYLPFFDAFRAPSKFMYFVSLLLAILAAEGLTAIGQDEKPRSARITGIAAGVVALAVLAIVGVLAIQGNRTGGLWDTVMNHLEHLPDQFNVAAFQVPEFRQAVLTIAIASLLVATATLLILTAILLLLRRGRLVAGLVTLGMLELIAFAIVGRASMPVELNYPQAWATAMADSPGRYRCLHLESEFDNAAMSLGTYSMWGYDPGILKRYAELIAASQGRPADQASQYIRFGDLSSTRNLYRMFRLRWVFSAKPEPRMAQMDAPLPQVQLVGAATVLPDRDAIFSKLLSPTFNPLALVYLESAPVIAPAGHDVTGSARVVEQDTDTLTIEAECNAPAILLITDNYAQGWKATALQGSSQQQYEVMPANYCLRAIPLAAGTHKLKLEYVPPGWLVGKLVSAVSLLALFVAIVLAVRRPKKKQQKQPGTPRSAGDRRMMRRT